MAYSGAQTTRPGLSGFARGLYGSFASKTQSDNPIVEVAEEANAGGWWFAYEQELERRRDEERKRKEAERKAQQIKDRIEREIALELRKQEAEEARIAELKRLAILAERHKRQLEAVTSERVVKAAKRASLQGNFSAMEALERELARAKEEEDFLFEALRMVINA